MKKIFSLVLAAVILVSFGILAGCEDNPQNNSASDSANGDNIVVQVANPAALPAADAKPTGWDTEWSKKLGIKLVQEFDSSGEQAWDVEKHPNVFITTEGPGYGGLTSKVTKPGVTIIDSDTNEVITSRHYDIGFEAYFEPHGLGVSENGKWIYLPTGDANAKIDKGRWLVIDAKTLKLHQIIQMRGNPHHAKVFRTAEGKSLILGEDFNWTNPGTLPGSGIYAFDPDDNNRVVGGIDASTLQANPYLAFPDPTGKYIMIGLPPGALRDIGHDIEGAAVIVDAQTWEPIKYFPIGLDPIWTVFSHDGKYAWIDAGGSDEVVKIDMEAKEIVGHARSGGHGPYGEVLSWDESQLWLANKGEASHNRGMSISLVDPELMKPLGEFALGSIRVDHATLHPNPDRHEIWVTSNSSFNLIRFDIDKKEVLGKIDMPNGGSTHSGSFVKYNKDWTGQVLSDMSGLHGDALKLKEEIIKKKNKQ